MTVNGPPGFVRPPGVVWPILAVLTFACAASLNAVVIASTVQDAERYPYADSGAPIMVLALVMLTGWTPLVLLVWPWWASRMSMLCRAPRASLRSISTSLGVRPPLIGWSGWLAVKLLMPCAIALTVWQFVAERHHLSASLVYLQLLIFAAWAGTAIQQLARCQSAVEGLRLQAHWAAPRQWPGAR
ncbi:hypothetical protein G9U51_11400 [Calidifontibacter sp. DB0510]|uniref:Uncharacterized protein n=1 Tax=Metallococcus carri TaxID=1656884 RepID=A0A967B2K7_9MICO|nr:hypothetical protein [Metallococcus carri]NHN56383.1 hypothetical protein [Metallococcus carri]NOP36007.1 hypothetical protein [Calidifontibacter sp. DB2511S]